MARRHRYAGDGLEIESALSVKDLSEICDLAVAEKLGDHWHGMMNVDGLGWKGGSQAYDVHKGPAVIRAHPMHFLVTINDRGSHRELSSTIIDYTTIQTKLWYLIPVGRKRMVAHHVYMQYMEIVANTVAQNDPRSWCFVRSAKTNLLAPDKPVWESSVPRLEPSQAAPQASAAVPEAAVDGEPEATPEVEPARGESSVAVLAALEPDQSESVDEHTRVVPRRGRATGWRLRWGDAEGVSVDGPMVFGRDPEPPSELSDARAIRVDSGEDSVSKTHAVVHVDDGKLQVTDLGSTNGTRVVTVDGAVIECPANAPTPVPDGAEIELGAFVLRAERLEGEAP